MATKKESMEADALDASVSRIRDSLEATLVREASGCDSKPGAPEKGHQSASARSTPTVPDGIRACERYCVLVRVTRDPLGLSKRDIRIPSHSWKS